MTSVYVQGEKSLIPIQEEVTAESIEEALGYVPADAEDIIECIEESDDTTLYVTDKDGNIITKTDGEGFHASAMTVNGKDVESGLVTDEDRESWGGSDLDDVISKDDDSTLYVVDKDNNVLAKIDSEGLKAIEVYVGEDQKSVSEHIEDESSHTTTEEKEALSALSSSDDSVLYVTDKNGDIIAKIDKDGLHTTEVYIGDETGEKTVADMLATLVGAAPETLNTLEELATAFKEHEEVAAALDEAITNKANAADLKKHEAAFESHKGDSTHLGDEIKLDDDTSLCIVDKDGKIIAKIDGDGLDVTDLKVSSLPIDEYINDVVENNGEACDHEYVTIQELIRNTTDCTTWKDLQYCSSCGKVHANPVHSGHDLVTVAAQEPTYSSIGWNEYKYCTRCDYSTYEELPMKIANITYTIKNCTAFGGATTCTYGKVSEARFGADAYATAPDDVIVTNCDYTWDKSTGTLTMSNPTGDIEVTVNYTYSLSITTLVIDEGTAPCDIEGDIDGDNRYDSVIVDTSTPIKVKLTSKTQPSTGRLYTPIVYDGSTGATFSIDKDTTTSDPVYILTISNISTNVTVLISGIISDIL